MAVTILMHFPTNQQERPKKQKHSVDNSFIDTKLIHNFFVSQSQDVRSLSNFYFVDKEPAKSFQYSRDVLAKSGSNRTQQQTGTQFCRRVYTAATFRPH